MKKIVWVLKVPEGVRVMIKDGDKVCLNDVVYELEGGSVIRLPLKGWKNLKVSEKEEVKKKVDSRKLVKNELLWSYGWFGLHQLRSPMSGKCLGVDDLGMIMFLSESEAKYCSPITCQKVRVEKEKINFDLEGWEMEAEGMSKIRGWGEFRGKWVKSLSEISSNIKDEVIVVEGEEAIVAKAEALGVGGIILVGMKTENNFQETEIPIVKMEKKEVEDLIKLSKESAKSRVWLNPSSGKVLLVLE
ncbi:hypothetical protein COS78_04355 [Candidatus Shapirobacteria bacterium CG06_land_8_20_14_3_00_40_12]|uniref:Uncharacterized protein n=2 Tax=Candidatus Shapironibacteriota TaxID=1752721 RepID=A0A2M7TS66_9BACT|nr:MAG: hypothetical protein COS78_04355 [Candidatus Shapirobacteria bacterium CG06_land_8_20_14_3_00_40_12]PIZ58456.1 MAG: hypothetical protein COY20_03655 [Candidatus Shapirobacteria bacterium CG_4_10_14_0_2_um_filter_40_12]